MSYLLYLYTLSMQHGVYDWTRCHDSAERIDVNRLGLLGLLGLECLRGNTKHFDPLGGDAQSDLLRG
jgi:hypothetical protein